MSRFPNGGTAYVLHDPTTNGAGHRLRLMWMHIRFAAPCHRDLERLAYSLWAADGCPNGDNSEYYWNKANQELTPQVQMAILPLLGDHVRFRHSHTNQYPFIYYHADHDDSRYGCYRRRAVHTPASLYAGIDHNGEYVLMTATGNKHKLYNLQQESVLQELVDDINDIITAGVTMPNNWIQYVTQRGFESGLLSS